MGMRHLAQPSPFAFSTAIHVRIIVHVRIPRIWLNTTVSALEKHVLDMRKAVNPRKDTGRWLPRRRHCATLATVLKPYESGVTMSLISVPVSFGELIDKITILEIKSERMDDAEKVTNVRHELALLEKTWSDVAEKSADISNARSRLRAVNESLWEIEDEIRVKESRQTFDDEFVELARAVYVTNDQRANIKKEINLALGSELIEEKSYQDYR